MALTYVQQQLYSYFSLVSVSSIKSALTVLEEVVNKLDLNTPCTSEQLSKEISQINRVIKKYDLEIVSIVDEVTFEKLYILINVVENVISQNSKFYDESTLQFFPKIVKDCVLSENGNLSETYCLNLSSQVKITKSAAQTILQTLISDKWLVSVDDKISLGMRTIAELEQNIKQKYPDNVTNCFFCKLIVIQGFICRHCKTKYHLACLKKYFSNSRSNHVCQSCEEVLEDVPFSEELEEISSINIGPPKKKKSRVSDE